MYEQSFISGAYFSAEQAVHMNRLRHMREAWELFTATRKHMEQRMLSKSPDVGKYVGTKINFSDKQERYICSSMLQCVTRFYFSELPEMEGQLSTLASQINVGVSEVDSRPLSPTSDFNLNSLNKFPSIEILQVLLDDWNKAQFQKLTEMAGVSTVADIYPNGQNDTDFVDYTRATCHLAQCANRSVRYSSFILFFDE